jgi:hypothetical protein
MCDVRYFVLELKKLYDREHNNYWNKGWWTFLFLLCEELITHSGEVEIKIQNHLLYS